MTWVTKMTMETWVTWMTWVTWVSRVAWLTRVTRVTRVTWLEGGKLSISLFLGVGNRPPRKKKIGNPRVPGGMVTGQIKPCITRGFSGESSIFSRWVARQLLY